MILKVLLYAYIPKEVIFPMSRSSLLANFSERLQNAAGPLYVIQIAHILRSLLDLFDATVQ